MRDAGWTQPCGQMVIREACRDDPSDIREVVFAAASDSQPGGQMDPRVAWPDVISTEFVGAFKVDSEVSIASSTPLPEQTI